MSRLDYDMGYLQALADMEGILGNAVANLGGIDIGDGVFVKNAYWDYEIRDQINELRVMLPESKI